MSLNVRTAVPQDATAFAEAHVAAWKVAYEGIVPADYLDSIDVTERANNWAAILRGEVLVEGVDRPTDLVVELDGDVIGFADVGQFRDLPDDLTAGELWAMYVHPDHWGAGAGYALMVACKNELRRLGKTRAYLWVLGENELARRFYERNGWKFDQVSNSIELGGADLAHLRYSWTPIS